MLQLKFEKVGNFSTDKNIGEYEVKIIPYDTNCGENVELIKLDGDLLTDLQGLVEQTWNVDKNSTTENGYIIIEMDMLFFDKSDEFISEIEEMTEDYEKIYKQQITRNMGAYAKYHDALLKLMIDNDDKRKWDCNFLGGNARAFADEIEEMDWDDLTNLSEEHIQEMIDEDIQETYLQFKS